MNAPSPPIIRNWKIPATIPCDVGFTNWNEAVMASASTAPPIMKSDLIRRACRLDWL